MLRFAAALVLFVASLAASAQPAAYGIQPGDLLRIAVWGDERLQGELRVLPDGAISFPLVGSIEAAGQSVEALRAELARRIGDFVPEPEVSVAVVEAAGSQVYVIGNVGNPGAFPLMAPLTVTRALALAGGPNAFADTKDIRIIRGEGARQHLIDVDYHELLEGRDLSSNHLLVAGDTVLVP
ncbi:MAG: polysaccharide biosynthesis/export family protein [Halieaceae bacterium]|jgi:polysaccharide export outer membrane protein|nr:polysaccharide biosynthesis/export family protein [Halieaceae bacterium]